MSKKETMNTKIMGGYPENHSPANYAIRSKVNHKILSEIKIQKGPITEENHNGILVEDLILICIDQLEHFQDSPYSCEENKRTLHHLRCALDTTRARQYERIIRGVQGKMEK